MKMRILYGKAQNHHMILRGEEEEEEEEKRRITGREGSDRFSRES